MIRTNFLKAFMAVCLVSLTMVACNKEEALSPDLELRTLTLTDGENNTNKRGGKCFKLNLPISISTINGDEITIADREALKAFFENHKAEGGEKDDLVFAYPIEVTLKDGTEQLVASKEEMEVLKENCPQRARGNNGAARGNRTPCFKVVFPVTATAADGSTLTLENRQDLKKIKRSIKSAIENGDAAPSLNFPIEITTADGNVSIATQTAFDDLRAACKQN